MSIVGLCGRTVVRNAVQPDTPPITIIYTYNWRKTDFDRLRPWMFPSFYKKKKKRKLRSDEKKWIFLFFFFFVTQRFPKRWVSLSLMFLSFFFFFVKDTNGIRKFWIKKITSTRLILDKIRVGVAMLVCRRKMAALRDHRFPLDPLLPSLLIFSARVRIQFQRQRCQFFAKSGKRDKIFYWNSSNPFFNLGKTLFRSS